MEMGVFVVFIALVVVDGPPPVVASTLDSTKVVVAVPGLPTVALAVIAV